MAEVWERSGDGYFDGTAAFREALLWAIATRTQLERWELLVAKHLPVRSISDPEVWQMQYERTFCLAAAGCLFDALELLSPRLDVPALVRKEVKEARDLTQHWRDNMPVFNSFPRTAIPPRRSGKDFAERNPKSGPYGFFSWNSKCGPMLTPNVPAAELHQVIDNVERHVLAQAPNMARFIPARRDSPWSAERETVGWYPRGDA